MLKKYKFKKFVYHLFIIKEFICILLQFKNWLENIFLHSVKIYQKESDCADSILLLLNKIYQCLTSSVKDLQFKYDFVEILFFIL